MRCFFAFVMLAVLTGCLTSKKPEQHNAIVAGTFGGSSGINEVGVNLSDGIVYYRGFEKDLVIGPEKKPGFGLLFRHQEKLVTAAINVSDPSTSQAARSRLRKAADQICTTFSTFLVNVHGPKSVGNESEIFRIRFEEPGIRADGVQVRYYWNTHFTIEDGKCADFIPPEKLDAALAIAPITLSSGTTLAFERIGVVVFTEGQVRSMFTLTFDTDTPAVNVGIDPNASEADKATAGKALDAEALEICREHSDEILDMILEGPIPDEFGAFGIVMRRLLNESNGIKQHVKWTSIFTIVDGRCGVPFNSLSI